MKKKSNKPEVTKENGELFETVFGKDMKAKDVEYVEKKEHIIKSMIDGGDTPLGLKIVSSIFGYLQTFFTMFLPIGLIFAVCLNGVILYPKIRFDPKIIIAILEILGISVGGFCVLKILEFLLSAFMIWIYSSVLTNTAGRSAVLQERIRSHLKTEDSKNQNTPENDTKSSMNPEDSPQAMANAVNRIVDIFYASIEGSIEAPERTQITRLVMTILFNIYKNGYNGRLDVPDNLALAGIENPGSFEKDMVNFVLNIANDSEWFTKPF